MDQILTAEEVALVNVEGAATWVKQLCDSHEALRAQVQQMEQAQRWQPMETAPRDGSSETKE